MTNPNGTSVCFPVACRSNTMLFTADRAPFLPRESRVGRFSGPNLRADYNGSFRTLASRAHSPLARGDAGVDAKPSSLRAREDWQRSTAPAGARNASRT